MSNLVTYPDFNRTAILRSKGRSRGFGSVMKRVLARRGLRILFASRLGQSTNPAVAGIADVGRSEEGSGAGHQVDSNGVRRKAAAMLMAAGRRRRKGLRNTTFERGNKRRELVREENKLRRTRKFVLGMLGLNRDGTKYLNVGGSFMNPNDEQPDDDDPNSARTRQERIRAGIEALTGRITKVKLKQLNDVKVEEEAVKTIIAWRIKRAKKVGKVKRPANPRYRTPVEIAEDAGADTGNQQPVAGSSEFAQRLARERSQEILNRNRYVVPAEGPKERLGGEFSHIDYKSQKPVLKPIYFKSPAEVRLTWYDVHGECNVVKLLTGQFCRDHRSRPRKARFPGEVDGEQSE